MALSIVQNPNANFGEKLLAGGYIALEATAHAGLVVGTSGLVCAVAGPGCVKAVEGALGIGTGISLDGDPTNEALAAARTAESVMDKLQRYLLNPDHIIGGPKANWFEKALGFTRDNLQDLAKQIVFDNNKAVPTELTQFGQKYEQIISITGTNGRVIDVPFTWIKNLDGVIRLVTVPWIPEK